MPLILLGIITSGTFLVRIATALINPITQVTVTHYFGKFGAHAIGLLSCIQFICGGIGAMIVTQIPFSPSISLVISSLAFTLISLLGYIICPRNVGWSKN